MTDILVLSDEDIRAVLPRRTAIEGQKEAFVAAARGRALGGGHAHAGQRPDDLVFDLTGIIPGRTAMASKYGMQVPGNHARGLAAVHAVVTLLDPETGLPLACLNGTTVTTMRTSCGLAAAADVLATATASRLAILGSGVQAREVARCIAEVRSLRSLSLWSRDPDNVAAAVDDLADLAGRGCEVKAARSPAEAIAGCDIVVCATSSLDPVVAGRDLAGGATVLTMGSYHRGAREIDQEVTRRAAGVFVDDRSKALDQCGPIVEALAAQLHGPEAVRTIAEVIEGRHPGRQSGDELLVFHSTGLGVQDAVLATDAFRAAVTLGRGRAVRF